MSTYQPGDYVKVEFRDDTGESEWMWVKVEHADDEEEVVFGDFRDDLLLAGTQVTAAARIRLSPV
jgi:hypothetical protein